MDVFENIPEQAEAKRLLRAALADEGPAHSYLFHGPPGVGKRAAAVAFAGELIGPRDGRYEAARRVWNGMVDRRPALIARCADGCTTWCSAPANTAPAMAAHTSTRQTAGTASLAAR